MSFTREEINDLFVAVSNDDEMAFRSVFDYYKRPFYSTAFRIMHSKPLAEEIVQEVFVTVWEKRRLICAARNPQGYVFSILNNCIYAYFRKVARERKIELKLAQGGQAGVEIPEDILKEKEAISILESLITRLPPQQKLVFRMSMEEGVSRREIAEKLNISPHTVRNHLAAATENLRVYLKKLNWLMLIIYTQFM